MEGDARLMEMLRPNAKVFRHTEAPELVIQNVALTFNIGVPINQAYVCSQYICSQFRPARFGAVALRFLPKAASLVFAHGACNCVGSSGFEKARFACQITRLALQRLFPTKHLKFDNLTFRNVVLSVDIGFPLRNSVIAANHFPEDAVEYHPEKFPSLYYSMRDPRIKLGISDTGKINFTGQQKWSDTLRAYYRIKPLLEMARRNEPLPPSKDRFSMRKRERDDMFRKGELAAESRRKHAAAASADTVPAVYPSAIVDILHQAPNKRFKIEENVS